jgi:tRNA pseudouridine55 synthase
MREASNPPNGIQGILLVDKPKGKTSFSLVSALRKRLGVQKIGHAGTLDPFATGVMVMLIGKKFTQLSDRLLSQDKEYLAQLRLGITTNTYDCDGQTIATSDNIPSEEQLAEAIAHFQGEIEQIPPMFSAKKVNGKKLYELARQGTTIERKAVKVRVEMELISYQYPFATVRVSCSKGTYVRSLAYEIGERLGCGAHLTELQRTRSGLFKIGDCVDGARINDPDLDLVAFLRHSGVGDAPLQHA